MAQTLTLFVFSLAFGAVLGAIVVWLIMRNSTLVAQGQVRSEAQIESVRLSEKLSASTDENNEMRRRLEAADGKLIDLREQLEKSRDERTRQEERANRVPGLESQLAQLSAELQKQTSRAAGLEEQATRLPTLEEKLRLATIASDEMKIQLAAVREKLGGADSTVKAQEGRIGGLEADLAIMTSKRDQLSLDHEQLKTQIAQLTTSIEADREQAAEKLALLKDAKEQLTASFKSLANEILEEKSARFAEENKVNIGSILDPLKTKIQEFQGKVEQVYIQEMKDRTALSEQVKQLMTLNQQLSQDANNLTLALKGSNKTQGNWGEMILERVLEDSGLRKDHEFLIRPTYSREDGTRAQPDAVILLPENRNLVVDAKVSLVAYENYTNAENDGDRAVAIQGHVASVRTHINELAACNYQGLDAVKSLDFVVLFVPIEPAFIIAVASDTKLWQEAWRKNVLLVSPSIFLFVVSTVANLWRQELQKRSVQDIVKRGAELYDKLVGFVDDLKKVGERLVQAKDSYDGAYAKLYTGKGNVIRQAELLKGLGIKPTKSLPTELVETAVEISALPGDGPMAEDPNGLNN
jgi:DNA recombination protein RmuC